MPPKVPETDKDIVKNFAGLAKDTKRNRIYSQSATYRVLTRNVVYLLALDKKEVIKTGIPAYSFMDVLGQKVKEEDIWFCVAMAIKGQRDEVAIAAFNMHQQEKARRWRQYKRAAIDFWYDRIVYEYCLLEKAWGQPGVNRPYRVYPKPKLLGM